MAISILIVDDQEAVARTLARYFGLIGYQTFVAHSGSQALKMLPKCKPHMVVLDIGMPEMDGYEVARRIRQNPKYAKTILIALTGYASKEDKLKASEAGFNHHIEKPATMHEIKRIIDIYDFEDPRA